MSLCRVLTRSRGLARRHRFPARSCTSYPLLHPELDTFHASLGVEDFKRDFNTYVGQHHALRTAVQQQHLRASSTLPSERRHTLPQEPPMCQCGIPKIVRVVSKVGPNMGREFFVCPKPMGTQCQGDFQWCDEPVPPTCSCGKPKVKRMVRKSGPNTGREFFTCPKPYIPACTSSFEWCDTDFKGPGPKCACGNRKVMKITKNMGPNHGRHYLVCPNPQTCDDAFEWVEPRESDFERKEQEAVSGGKGKEMGNNQDSDEDYEEEQQDDLRGFVPPACDLFNEARWSNVDKTPSLTEVLRLPYPKSSSHPSVTRILQATMSEESKAVLARWEARMIRELGEEGFRQHKKDTFERGHRLHRVVEEFLETGSVPDMDEVEDPVSKLHLLSFAGVREHLSQPFALESAVEHKQLGYSGIVDCVARYKDQLLLIDWKTAEREKTRVEDLYDNPIQLAAYLGAINQDPRYSELGNLTSAAVCVVHNSGIPAVTHVFNSDQMSMYWDKWLERLELYHSENI